MRDNVFKLDMGLTKQLYFESIEEVKVWFKDYEPTIDEEEAEAIRFLLRELEPKAKVISLK
jgi:hypothetical protein